MITLAIAAYTTNGDWQGPLEAAVRAHPSVDRAVGPNHRVRTWNPPPESGEDQIAVDQSIELYLDGQRVRYLPPLYGPHLVQVRRDGTLQSAFLMDQPVPEAWIAAPKRAAAASSVATAGGGVTSAVTQKSKKKRRTTAALIFGAAAAGTFGGSLASRVAYEDNPSNGAYYATNSLYVSSVTLGVTSAVLMIRALITKKENPVQSEGIAIRQWAQRYPQTSAATIVKK